MNEFDNLKRSYTITMQLILESNSGYHEAMHENELLHKFCENLVENSFYSDMNKAAMKLQLNILKETFSQEIRLYYNMI